jgi:nucleoside-diphosphate-sugar epimerase
MIILVTGATGGLGRNAVEFLTKQGIAVRATGRDRNVGKSLHAIGVEFVPLDLASASLEEIERLVRGVDAVWHCAALSSPWGRREDFYAANVIATTRLAQASIGERIRRFVHISTPSLYFDFTHRHDIDEAFRPVRYANDYARTKAEAERVVLELAALQGDTTFVLLRPRGIFGPHDRVLLPRVLQVLRERGGRLPLPRGGAVRIDLTYVHNVVHAMFLATTRAVPSGSVYNITNGESTTLRDMLDGLLRPLGVGYRIVLAPYPVVDLAARLAEGWASISGREPLLTRYSAGVLNYDMTLSLRHAREQLDYRPPTSLERGIEATVNWIRSHGHHYGL